MHILCLTLYASLGSSKVRVLEFVPHLEKLGVHCTVRSAYSDNFYHVQLGSALPRFLPRHLYLLLCYGLGVLKRIMHITDAWRYDTVLIQKDTLPEFIFRVLKLLNPNIVYEFDDTISESNPHVQKGHLSRLLLQYRSHLFRRSCARAKRVIAENSYLRDVALRHNPDVVTITAPVDTDIYVPGAKKNRPEVVIGWLGSPSTTHLVARLEPVFAALVKRHSNIRIVLTGAGALAMPGVPLEVKPWSAENQRHDLQDYDIGLMPLDDHPFNRGRLGYKMILYMSSAVPIVASDIGLNRDVVQHGENGFLCADHTSWVDNLSRLVTDAALRAKLGQRGREIACEQYARSNLARRLSVALQF